MRPYNLVKNQWQSIAAGMNVHKANECPVEDRSKRVVQGGNLNGEGYIVRENIRRVRHDRR